MSEKKWTAVIIDDEKHARNLLRGMIETYCPDLTILGEAEDLPSGVKLIRKQMPDLVFLDIEMPGHSGLELLEFFDDEEVKFNVIFTTAYQEYAVKAFKLSALDYLLKPIEPHDLEETFNRFRKGQQMQQQTDQLKLATRNVNLESIAIPLALGLKFVSLEDIIYLKADNSYTEVYLKDGTCLTASRTLKNFEDALEGDQRFLRCHKSYLVNILFVSDWIKSDGGYLLMKNGDQVSVTSEKAKELSDKFTLIRRNTE